MTQKNRWLNAAGRTARKGGSPRSNAMLAGVAVGKSATNPLGHKTAANCQLDANQACNKNQDNPSNLVTESIRLQTAFNQSKSQVTPTSPHPIRNQKKIKS